MVNLRSISQNNLKLYTSKKIIYRPGYQMYNAVALTIEILKGNRWRADPVQLHDQKKKITCELKRTRLLLFGVEKRTLGV
jgi:hypothetical protein